MNCEEFIENKSNIYRFSFQDKRELVNCSNDLIQWGETSIEELWDDSVVGKAVAKSAKQKVLKDFYSKYSQIRDKKKSYTAAISGAVKKKVSVCSASLPLKIVGKCPVASDKTRCCNLETVDIVTQCGFACTYCSIQSFYNEEKIELPNNLEQRLDEISETLDKNKIYHFGTGQSSDSLMWGNENSILENLFSFAKKNPNIILELKSKSDNVSYLLENEIPKNVICTWSLNPEIIVANEERLTSSVLKRLEAAKAVQAKGALVGFHFHPIVYYENWENDYKEICDYIQNNFDKKNVVQISLGTLTFIKPVIKKIRESKIPTKILQMNLTEIEGKYSYPLLLKEKLFKTIYNYFSDEWKKNIFFYMCMEEPTLWKKVFNYEYSSNEEFEKDMKKHYMDKILSI